MQTRQIAWIVVVFALSLAIAAVLLLLNDDSEPSTAAPIESTTSTSESTTEREDPDSENATTTTTIPPQESSTTSQPPISTTLPPKPLPEADPESGQDQADPVPYQTSVTLDRWRIGVSMSDFDAVDIITSYVEFNDPPPEGQVYVIVELTGQNVAGSISQPVFDWKLTQDDFEHTPDGLECGVVPNSVYDVGDVFPGDSFAASVCFQVPEEVAGEQLLLSLGLFDNSGRELFFSLR